MTYIKCFRELLDMNFFNTSLSQLDRFEREHLPEILSSIKEGAEVTNQRMQDKIKEIHKKKSYLTVETPVQWAQSLSHVFIEVRYAHRHDAPGCSRSEDEQVSIREDRIEISVFCLETTSKVKYHLTLTLWGLIDVERSSHSYQAVGKQHVTLQKANAPGRWLQLYSENAPRPINYRLWLQHHERHVV
jgi:hypothetical protein